MINEYKSWKDQIAEKCKYKTVVFTMDDGKTVTYTVRNYIDIMCNIFLTGQAKNTDMAEFIAQFFGVNPKEITE